MKLEFFIGSLPLEKLFSGSYLLVCEAKKQVGRNCSNSKVNFFRIKNSGKQQHAIDIKGTFVDEYSVDQLKRYIDYIYPIQKNREGITAQSLLQDDDTDLMKNFFSINFGKTDTL